MSEFLEFAHCNGSKGGEVMPTGTVKWFNNAKGYGFILPEDEDSDVFAHYSAIEMEGYKTLKAGQRVDFELVDGDKGKHAAHITLVKGAADSESVESQETESDQPAASATG
tara:strand:+ start:708 stop:1040 length:333 start_codon:yes stop_codon:yes gene_type:complete